MRIAMWSGPRNLSTAMMYAFGARSDCAIMDEPFYAAFLAATGADHPMADEIIAAHDSDARSVAAACAGPIPGAKPHLYMKHMPHHMMAGFPMAWADECRHAHLLRHPARVIASYAAKQSRITAADIAYERQFEIWQRYGGPVIESETIRSDPKAALTALCQAIGIEFQDSMLCWPLGGRAEDGIWAKHWYAAVQNSTGFAGPEGALPQIPSAYAPLLDAALPIYHEMRAAALTL